MTQTTFSVASSSQDGVYGAYTDVSWATLTGGGGTTDGNYSTDPTAYAARGRNSTGTYYTYNAYMRFDTSSIPDTDVVSAATLRLQMFGTANANSDAFDIMGVYFNWGVTISAADYAFDVSTLGPTAFAAKNISDFPATGTYDIALTNLTNISKTSLTYLVLGPQGTTPTPTTGQDNNIEFYTYDHTTQPEPKLIVTHDAPSTLPDSVGMIFA